jgi:hypothetical protein
MAFHGSRGRGEFDGGDGRRDSEHRALSIGLILPVLLAIWALINWATGRAYLPTKGHWLLFTDWWGVSALASAKLGAGVSFFGWYYLANRERWQRWAELVTCAGVGVIVLSILAVVLKLLRS